MTFVVPLLLAAAWQVMPERCDGTPLDDAALVEALELELPPAPSPARLEVRGCDGDVWIVSTAGRERRFELGAVVPRLQRRTLALLVREFVLQPPATPSATPTSELLARADAARREGRVDEAVRLLEQVAARTGEPDAMVAALTLARLRPPPGPRPLPRWELALTGRLFFSAPVSGAAGLALTARPWWRLVLSLHGLFTATSTAFAHVVAGVEVVGLGVRLVDLTSERCRFGVELGLEGGVAHTHVTSLLEGFVGGASLHAVFGGAAAVQGQLALSDSLALTATVRGGADRGVVVQVLGESALALAGAFVTLDVGVAF